MRFDDHLTRLHLEGEAFAEAAAAGPLDARVPGCPAWDAEALVRHMGDVHRWAATVVRERVQERLRQDFEGPSDPAELLTWYREGHTALLEVLRSTPVDAAFWAWGPAPNPLAFWARRQAHETGMHRWDLQSAHGGGDPFPTDVAIDGLDEWLGLAQGRARVANGEGRTIHLHATDGEGEWFISLEEKLDVRRGHAKADCAVRGDASDLWLLAMNRRGTDGLEVFGDASLLQIWKDNVRF